MTLRQRLRGGTPPSSGATSESLAEDDGDLGAAGPGALVEVRPAASARTRGRFGRIEQAATSVALWVLRLLVLGAGLVAVFWLLGQLWSVVLPLVLALILSTVLWPAVRLMRQVMPAALAALIALLVFLGAIVGIFAFLIPRVVAQAGGLADQIIAGFEQVQQQFQGGVLGVPSEQVNAWVDQGIQRVQDNAQQIAGSVGGGLLTGLVGVGSALVTLLLVLVLTFFFTKDGPAFLPWLHLWSGSRVADHADELLGRIWHTLGGYILSQAAVALVDAVFIGLGLWVLGIPFAFPLAVLVFFAAFIPIVGAVATGALAVLVALFSNGLTDAIWVLVLVLVVQQVESNVLQPVLVGKTLALHPAVVIAAVTVGATLAGIVGAFLAVPVTAVAVVVSRYVREAVLGEEPQTGGDVGPVLTRQDRREVERRASEGEDTTASVDTEARTRPRQDA